MKKVLVVTYVKDINYGAALQAYATNVVLEKLGVSGEFLNIEQKRRIFKNVLKVKSIKESISALIRNFYSFVHVQNIKDKINKFEKFVSDNFCLTKEYKDQTSVVLNPPMADLYMTGSDQMFNTYNGIRPAFFLEFVPDRSKRFSYATSMGNYLPCDADKERFTQNLKKYIRLSIREENSVEYLQDMGLKAERHVDPTFLLTQREWQELIKDETPIINEPYILVYSLQNHPLTNELIKKMRRETTYKIVCVTGSAWNRVDADVVIRNAGPIDFVNLIKNSVMVISTSFHGVCFSIIFEKDFYALVHKNEKRIVGIAELLGVQNRVISNYISNEEKKIDWTSCKKTLEIEKKRSFKYLRECIEMEV